MIIICVIFIMNIFFKFEDWYINLDVFDLNIVYYVYLDYYENI